MSAPLIGHKDWQKILLDLPQNWDNYNGRPITRDAIDTLEQFAVVPCSSGGIQLEVHRDGFDIEIDIGPDGKIRSALVVAERLAP